MIFCNKRLPKCHHGLYDPAMYRTVLLLIAAVLAAPPRSAAENLDLEGFLGHWTGSAIGQQFTSEGLRYAPRDLDVTVSRTEVGFEITWTTLIRSRDSTAAPERRETSLSFARTGPAEFVARDLDNVGLGGTYGWARIEERALIVYLFEIGSDGVYELSRYARTLSPTGVMDLDFTRLRDGRTEIHVTGHFLPDR